MRFLSIPIAIIAAVAVSASAADARSRHTHDFAGRYAAYGSGLSKPYDASGRTYSDFQLQGR